MKNSFLIIVLIVASCSGDKGTKSTLTDTKDSTSGTNEASLMADMLTDKDTTRENDEKEIDCVFNSDYKGLTTEWLAKIGKTNFAWRTDLDQASIPSGRDTIYVSKGGCEHMGMLVELRLSNDSHTITDSTFWLDKALTLVTEFGLTQYEQMIKEKRIKRIGTSTNVVWFEIEDDNLDDNLYYNGVEIKLDKKPKVISLSQYYN